MGWVWSYNRDLLGFAFLLLVLSAGVNAQGRGGSYYGVRIGPLEQLHHAVKGDVYAVDSRTIHIRGFSYDGTAPDAFFYAGTTPQPSEAGFIIPDENGGVTPLGRYRNQDITLTLPDGKTFKDIRWISVWCRAFSIDFGNVKVSPSLEYPRPQKIDALPTLEHGVSSDRIVVVDAQTFLIPNFHYDGAAPDARFWVGKGNTPGPKGTLVPDENGSEEPLKKYSGKTIVITLPGDLTIFDIDFLSVWCRAFFADFGHVRIPKSLNVPPSLKMLGVAPQSQNSGYSYQQPSGRPAFSYAPKTNTYEPPPTTFRPSYSPPTRPSTSPRPPYKPRESDTRPPYSPPSPFTTARPSYQEPTTRRTLYKPPTTRRPFYEPPETTRRPYAPPTTTPRPHYRRPHFDSDESREVFGGGGSSSGYDSQERPSFPPRPTSAASHFSIPQKSTSAFGHFGSSASRHRDDDSDEERSEESSRGRFPPAPHRFGSPSTSSRSSSESKKSLGSYHFSNGGSTSSFTIYG